MRIIQTTSPPVVKEVIARVLLCVNGGLFINGGLFWLAAIAMSRRPPPPSIKKKEKKKKKTRHHHLHGMPVWRAEWVIC